MGFFSAMKHTARMAKIAWVLARNDALFGLESLNAPIWLTAPYRLISKRQRHLREGERLARALIFLGPSFIKIGQALSTRADLVGEAIASDLSHLQDNLPPFDSAIAKRMIEEDLGASISEIFADFEDAPIAAASIAQVHVATSKEGQKLAVKVLRPGVDKAFLNDVDMLLWLAHKIAAKNASIAKRFKPVEVVQTLAATIKLELDFRYEAAAAEELKHNTRNDAHFFVPAVDWARSNKRVLSTEFIEGFHASDREGMQQAGINPDDITKHAAEAFFNQVFRDGFFHADMHPGNLFVLKDGRLAPVDFGIMGRIDTQSQLYLAEILWGFLKGDYMRVARLHKQAGYIPEHVSTGAFAQACRAIGQPIMDKPLNEISVGKLLGQLIMIADDFEMQVQPHLLLLQKTMVTAEGVGRGLNPHVNMWKLAEPLITEWANTHLSPPARLKLFAKETAEVLRDMPRVLKETRAFMDDMRAHGVPLTPESFANLANAKERQHKASLRLGWATLISIIGLALIHHFA